MKFSFLNFEEQHFKIFTWAQIESTGVYLPILKIK